MLFKKLRNISNTRNDRILIIILLLGLILRLFSLNQSLWLDEAIGAIAVRDYSYLGIITDFIKGDTHPPLYYLTLKFWTDLFGYSETAMRMLSVVFGVITVWVVYLVARELERYGLRVASSLIRNTKTRNWLTFPLITGILFATAPLHIYYSQEVRMYAMNTLLFSLVVLFYLKKDWWKYSITLLILGMTDYLPLFILPVLWLDFFVVRSYRSVPLRSRMTFLLSHLPLVIFLFLWFPTFLVQSAGSREALQLFPGWGQLIGRAGVKELVLVWVKFLIGRISFDSKLLYCFIVLLLSFVVAFPLFKSAKKFNKTKLLWFWLIIPVALTFIGAIFVPGFSYFRMIIVLPAFYLLIAYGLTSGEGLPRRMANLREFLIPAVIVVNIVLSLTYLLNSNYHREDWRGAVDYIQSNAQSGDIVLQLFPEPFAGYRWYANSDLMPAYGATGKLGATDNEIKKNTEEVLTYTNGVYYFRYLEDQTDSHGVVRKTIKENGFTEISEQAFRGVGVVEYWRK